MIQNPKLDLDEFNKNRNIPRPGSFGKILNFAGGRIFQLLNAGGFKAWIIYFIFFLLLFIQFPLSGSLPGKVDSWLHLALFNSYGNDLKELFWGEWNGTAYYPEKNMFQFGEPTPGNGLLFLLFKCFGLSNLYSYYFFTALLFSLNGLGMFFLSRSLSAKFIFAFISGLFFSTSCFAFGQLDHPNANSWGPALFSISSFIDFLKTGERKFVIKTIFSAAFQIYFSGYIFVYLLLLLFFTGIFHIKKLWNFPPNGKILFPMVLLFMLVIYPYLHVYVINSNIHDSYNPAKEFHGAEIANLKPFDLLRSLPGNLLYSDQNYDEYPLLNSIRSANIGAMLWLLAISGLVILKRNRYFLIGIFSIGIILSVGPYLIIGSSKIPFLLKPAYDIGLEQYLRTPVRAFSIIMISLCISAGFFLEYCAEKYSLKKIFLVLPILTFFMENIPLPFRKYDSWKYLIPQKDYVSILKNNGKVLIELPSGIFQKQKQFSGSLDETNREHIYAYWQTFHHLNIPNGSNGFFPDSRLRNNIFMTHISQNENLQNLIKECNADFIVWHKNMILDFEKEDIPSFLNKKHSLQNILENETTIIFKVKK